MNKSSQTLYGIYETFDATPSYKLLETMGYGGYSLPSAVADIVDNSISAGAERIDISFVWQEDNGSFVEISDDGCGMSSEELEKAMIFASKGTDDERDDNDLGRYGLGMKTASMYACRCLTVISKKDGSAITAKCLDRDVVNQQGKWIGINLDHDSTILESKLKRGTVVRWERLSFTEEGENSKKYFLKYVESVHRHLEMVFHRFLESRKIVITINGNQVKPWNPICHHPAVNRFDSQKLNYMGSEITVSSYLMPSALSCTEEETEMIYRGSANTYQGFFVYRNERMIMGGGWMDLKKGGKSLEVHPAFNAVRITVDVPPALDSVLKVDFTKSSMKFPVELEEQLLKMAVKVRKKAREQSRRRTHALPQAGEKTEEIWKVKKKDNEYSFSINRSHPLIRQLTRSMDKNDFNELMQLLSKTVPVVGSDRKFTGSFTDEEMDALIQSCYTERYMQNRTNESIYSEMVHMEPFSQYPELVNAFFENLKTQKKEGEQE